MSISVYNSIEGIVVNHDQKWLMAIHDFLYSFQSEKYFDLYLNNKIFQ